MGQANFKFRYRHADRGSGVVVALVDVEAQWNEYRLLHNPENSSPVKALVWKKCKISCQMGTDIFPDIANFSLFYWIS